MFDVGFGGVEIPEEDFYFYGGAIGVGHFGKMTNELGWLIIICCCGLLIRVTTYL